MRTLARIGFVFLSAIVSLSALAIAPSITSAPPTEAELDQAYSYQIQANDPEGSALSYELLLGPAGMVLDNSGLLTWPIDSPSLAGKHNFVLRVVDGENLFAEQEGYISVRDPNNSAPVFNGTASTEALINQLYQFDSQPSDPDGDTMALSVSVWPETTDVTIDASGVVSWTPHSGQEGKYWVWVDADDGRLGMTQYSYKLYVRDPNNTSPVIENKLADATINLGQTFIYDLNASDADDDTLIYHYSIWPEVDNASVNSNGVLTWTPQAIDTYHLWLQADDGRLGTDEHSFKLHVVNAGNQDPVITTTPVTSVLVGNQYSYDVDATDGDNDSLTYSLDTSPSGMSIDANSGVITWLAAEAGDVPIVVSVSDGINPSVTQAYTLTVLPTANTAPVANPLAVPTNEDTSVTVTLTASDAEGDTLSYIVLNQPANGTLTGTAPNLLYAPSKNFSGSDSFTFQASDGSLSSAITTISITVSPINDAPTAQAQSVTLLEDATAAITLTGSDVDGDTLSYRVVTQPISGTVSGVAPNVSYTPSSDYNGTDSFSFVSNDGTVDSTPATVSLSITAQNDAPSIAPITNPTVSEGSTAQLAVNATDNEGDTLTYTFSALPDFVSVAGNVLTISPDFGDAGTHGLFSVSVSDGNAQTTRQFAIIISNVNRPPIADAQSLTTNEDQPLAITLTGSDPDNDVLTFAVTTPPLNGTLSGTAPNLVYTPTSNYSGTDSFQFSLSDGIESPVTQTVIISIASENDLPIAQSQSLAVNEDSSISIVLSALDSDGDVLTYSIVTQPSHGALSGSMPNVVYSPGSNFHGSDVFTFVANDGVSDSNLASVNIVVNSINDLPEISSQPVLTGSEDQLYQYQVIAQDVENDALLYSLTSAPEGMTISSGGLITWLPGFDSAGDHPVSIQVTDAVTASTQQDFVISINNSNRPPIIRSSADNFALVGSIWQYVIDASDPDGDALTYALDGSLPGLSFDEASRTVSWTPSELEVGQYSFSISVTDSLGGATNQVVNLEVVSQYAITSHEGREFWLSISNNWDNQDAVFTVYLVSPHADTTAVIDVPLLNLTETISLTQDIVEAYSINLSDMEFAGGTALNQLISDGAVHITSQSDLAVYAINRFSQSSDGLVVIPKESLGRDYIVGHYPGVQRNDERRSAIVDIVATANDTEVTITPTMDIFIGETGQEQRVPIGTPYVFSMQEGDVFKLQAKSSFRAELSGTTIRSNNEVAVFSGGSCINIPNTLACDHVVDQLIPADSLGTEYLVTPFWGGNDDGDTFKITAAFDGTVVRNDGVIVSQLDAGEYFYFREHQASLIQASYPIQLIQFSNSGNYANYPGGNLPPRYGDPSMLVVPAKEQYLSRYTFSSPDEGFEFNYVTAVLPNSAVGTLSVDGGNVPASRFVPISDSGYSYAYIPVISGVHRVTADEPFGLAVYGFDVYDSYSFGGGMFIGQTTDAAAIDTTTRGASTLGELLCFASQVTDRFNRPLQAVQVQYDVVGVNQQTAYKLTDPSGVAEFCYIGSHAGADQVSITTNTLINTESVSWEEPGASINVPPTILSLPRLTYSEGQQYNYQVVANDANGDDLTYSISSTNDFLSINSDGFITWTPSNIPYWNEVVSWWNINPPSSNSKAVRIPIEVSVTVTDSSGASTDQQFVIEEYHPFNNDPAFSVETPVQEAVVGVPYIYDPVYLDSSVWERGREISLRDIDGDKMYTNVLQSPTDAEVDIECEELREGPACGRFDRTIDWIPQTVGTETFEFEIFDSRGSAIASQIFDVTVAPNIAPTLTSSPDPSKLTVPVGGTFYYLLDIENDVQISSRANLDDIRVVFEERPSLFVSTREIYGQDGAKLQLRWRPLANQAGEHTVRFHIADRIHVTEPQEFTITVVNDNQVPSFSDTFLPSAEASIPYSHQLSAVDPDDDTLTYSLIYGPSGLQVSDGGLITWTPSIDLAYTSQRALFEVTDGRGGVDRFVYSILVRNFTNQAPVFSPTFVSPTAKVGVAYEAYLPAVDREGSPITYGLTTSLTGAAIDQQGRVSFVPSEVGFFSLVATATDDQGATGRRRINVTVLTPSDSANDLSATMSLSPSVVTAGDTFTASVTATNLASTPSVIFSSVGVDYQADTQLQTVIPSNNLSVGVNRIDATVFDGLQTVNIAADVYVSDPANTTPPDVTIHSPAVGSILTAPISVIASASDHIVEYVLYYRQGQDGELVELNRVQAFGDLDNTHVGQFDPTMLMNGNYVVVVEAIDANGQSTLIGNSVFVEGGLKVGNFTYSTTDLDIELAGMPITVSRTYDSRQRQNPLDFGQGWSIGYEDIRIEENVEPTQGWNFVSQVREQFLFFGQIVSFRANCMEPQYDKFVTVTLPNGDVEKFIARAQPSGGGDSALSNPNCYIELTPTAIEIVFDPIDGTDSELTSNVGAMVFWNGNFTFGDDPSPINITRYTLTTRDGTVYELDQRFGVRSVIEPNGNRVDFSDTGISHSTGRSVQFVRDSQGRISQVIDPAGNVAMQYQYNGNGDLVSATDSENARSRYTYGTDHDLQDIIDPLGRTVVRNIYNDEGRLIAQEDSDGNRTDFNHDIEGRQSVVTDRLGNTTIFYYNDRGDVLSQVDALGNTTSYTYDSDGNELTQTDALGNVRTQTYNESDDVLSITDALGNTTSYAYNARGQETTITDAAGNVFNNTYDSVGNLLSITDPAGNLAGNVIQPNGLVSSTTNLLGDTTSYTYDVEGNKLTETDSEGTVTSYTYDANNNVLTETRTRTVAGETLSESTSYEYDSRNRVIATIDALGNRIEMEYDLVGNESAQVDALGRRTEMDYDAYGRLTETRFPDGTTETKSYDAEGNMLSSTDRNGNTTTYEYDALNRQTAMITADGARDETEYDAVGRVVAQIDALGNRTEFEYDAVGRRTLVRDALGNEHHFEYDVNGNLTAEVDANDHRTEHSYNVLDQRTSTTFANASTTSDTLDAMGRRTAQTDQANISTQFAYDSLGRLTGVTDTLGNPTSYSYDEAGNKLTQTDAEGRTTTWTYDALGRVLTRTLPLGQAETMTYDDVGNMLTRTDFNGDLTTYSYDALNRVTAISYADGNSDTFVYDNNGNRSEATQTDALGNTRVTRYTYDSRNRLSRETQANGHILDYTYDATGNRTRVQITYPTIPQTIERTDYSYDVLNRLATVTDNAGNITSYSYDAAGNRASVLYPNGNSEVYSYDSLNRLTQKVTSDSTGAVLQQFDYTLHATGRRTQIDELTGRSTQYTYDDLYRLTNESITDAINGDYSASYSYDDVGNRIEETIDGVTTAYTYDDNDRLTQTGGTIFTHDANGNTLSETLDGNVTTYIWNDKNKLIETTNGSTTTNYLYNVDGIRTQQDAGSAIEYVVDSNRDYAQVLAEVTAGVTNVSYTYGDDLISQNRAANNFFYHYDGLGSTRALSDELGLLSDTYDYEAFGEVLNQTGTTENSYLFTGEQFDQGLDQYYLRARYYDQGVGRFTQMDTWMGRVRDPITLNKYLYAEADPADKIDPSGNISIGSQMSAINIQGTLSTLAVRGASRKALDIARRAKVFNVYSYAQMPVHFYMYVERKGSASGVRYDVGAPGGWGNLGQQLCRGNVCGRIPGFIQSRRASRQSLRGVRTRVARFSLGQYMLWHSIVMGTEQMECSIDITYSLVPGPNCLSWTISATAKAVAISRLRL